MPVVYVHGGVSGTPKAVLPSLSAALEAAASAATALDAVEAAVCALEDHPELNAGFGSVLNLDGELELDAGITDGERCRIGAVANVCVRHPISLARRVLETTPHVLVTGRGAMQLGADMHRLELTSEKQRRRWEEAKADGTLDPARYGDPEHVDTVGAVALGDDGTLAAGSSTGGVFGKLPGRVGDAPIFGAGIYASRDAAVVGTGVGELFLATLASLRVGRLIEDGHAPQSACEQVIDLLGTREPLAAGLLALDRSGDVGAAFRGASWAVEGPAGLIQAIQRP